MRGSDAERKVSSTEWWALLALFVLAICLRNGVVSQYEADHPLADHPVIDEASYEALALEISGGDWIGTEVFFQEPLYPYWMASVFAVFDDSRSALRTTQAGLGALTVLIVWALTRRLFGPAPAMFAAAAMATYRPALLFPSLLLKPNLFLPLIATLAWLLVASTKQQTERAAKRSLLRWFLVGSLAGLGALLRGNMLVLLPLFILAPLLVAAVRRSFNAGAIVASACVVLGISLALFPVAMRNHHVGGVWALTTSGAGTNVYGGNNEENPYGIAKEFSWVRGIPEYEAEDWRHEAERRLGRELNPTEVSRYWMGEVGDSIVENPWLHIGILWNKLRLTLGVYEVPDNHHLEWDARFVGLLQAPFLGYATWGWFSLAGMLLFAWRWRDQVNNSTRFEASTLVLFYLFYLATIVLTVTSMRARLALIPLMLPFGGWFAYRLTRAIHGEGRQACVFAALAAGVLVFPPVFSSTEREQKLAVRDLNWMTYRLAEQGPSEALWQDANELDERYPNTLRIWSLIGEIEFGLTRAAASAGDQERATRFAKAARARLNSVVEKAATNERERHTALVLLGDLASFVGATSAARVHYSDALNFDPDDAHVRRSLADSLLRLGVSDSPDAVKLIRAAISEYSRAAELDEASAPACWLGMANAQFVLAGALSNPERGELLRSAEAHLQAVQEHAPTLDVTELLDRVRAAK